MKIKTLEVTKNEVSQKFDKLKMTKDQLSKVCGGNHFYEDDEEYMVKHDEIKNS